MVSWPGVAPSKSFINKKNAVTFPGWTADGHSSLASCTFVVEMSTQITMGGVLALHPAGFFFSFLGSWFTVTRCSRLLNMLAGVHGVLGQKPPSIVENYK